MATASTLSSQAQDNATQALDTSKTTLGTWFEQSKSVVGGGLVAANDSAKTARDMASRGVNAANDMADVTADYVGELGEELLGEVTGKAGDGKK